MDMDKAFQDVFTTDAGKRVLFWMLEQSAIYSDAFGGEDNITNYTLGRQSIGRVLIGRLDVIDPRLYPQLLLDIANLKAMDIAAEKLKEPKEVEDE